MTESDLAAACARLDELDELDIAEHIAVYEAVHSAMRHELDGEQGS